jgi:hypothetical protein
VPVAYSFPFPGCLRSASEGRSFLGHDHFQLLEGLVGLLLFESLIKAKPLRLHPLLPPCFFFYFDFDHASQSIHLISIYLFNPTATLWLLACSSFSSPSFDTVSLAPLPSYNLPLAFTIASFQRSCLTVHGAISDQSWIQ